jgi:hypothetical protein
MIITVEELLEMLGVVILIHALVEYIHDTLGGMRLEIGPPAASRRNIARCETDDLQPLAT